jgi:hypothetical protein
MYSAHKKTTNVADPYVLGLPDPDSLVRETDYGSGFFYHQAKIIKALIPTVL